MGAPKQKWTSEEEAALKAGILKHGPGKWRTILKDPEFSGVLCLRSNVDLKDKWRNMTVMANGWSSREQARLAVKRTKQAPRQDGSPVADTTTAESDEEAAEAQAATTSSGSPQIHGSRKSMIRLDNLIMEAISSLKEPGGSNKTTIAAYIEDQYWAPPNFIRLLSGKLKYLTATGKLIKIKRKYRVASTSTPSDRRRNLSSPLLDSRQRIFSKVDRDYMDMLSTSQIDLEIANKMRNMTPKEAAAAAAQAVTEAEAAIAEAEVAARDAEAHEADAEAAKAFSDATKTLHGRSAPPSRMIIRA